MATTILSRSPYLVNVNDTNLSYVTIEVYVYTGTQTTDRPATPTYTLNSTAVNDSCTFDVAALANDAIQQPANNTYRTDGAWLDYRVTKYINNAGTVTSSVGSFVQLYAVDGYSYFSEGHNFQSDRGLLTSNNLMYVPTGETVYFPINKRLATHMDKISSAGVILDTVTFNANNQSGQQFSYLSSSSGTISKVKVHTQLNNLFSNGTFNNGTNGITALSGSSVSNVDNQLVITGNGSDYSCEVSLTDLDISQGYTVSFEYVSGSRGVGVQIEFDNGDTLSPTTSYNTAGMVAFNFSPNNITDTDATLRFKLVNGNTITAGNATIDNLSVYVTTEKTFDEFDIVYMDECKYSPVKLKFVNRYGAMEDLWFFKRTDSNITIEKEQYQNNIIDNAGGYNIYEHQQKLYNLRGKESFTLNSGFVPESMNETFKQLLHSHKVWTTKDDGNDAPVIIKNEELSFKTTLNDKLINYTIDVEYANNSMNNVR